MTEIRSPLGTMARKPSSTPKIQEPPRKTYFVSDESEKNFEIPELDHPQVQPTRSSQQPEVINFDSAKQFNEFRAQYLNQKKAEPIIDHSAKENLEFLLGLGVRTDTLKVGDFGFELRTLSGEENKQIEIEVEEYRNKLVKDNPSIDFQKLETMLTSSKINRVLARSIYGVCGFLNDQKINQKSFDDFVGSSDYQHKLYCVSHLQEPLIQLLILVWNRITNKKPDGFPTIEELNEQIKK